MDPYNHALEILKAVEIFEKVAANFGMSADQLREEKKTHRAHNAMKVFAVELKNLGLHNKIPTTQLGKLCGRDHTTIGRLLNDKIKERKDQRYRQKRDAAGIKESSHRKGKEPTKDEEEIVKELIEEGLMIDEICGITGFTRPAIIRVKASIPNSDAVNNNIGEGEKIHATLRKIQMRDFERALKEEMARRPK